MTLFQWRSRRDGVTGGPGVELQFKPDGDRLEIVGTSWAAPYEGRRVLVSDTATDRWYDFICTVTYSVSDGAARCWVDGRPRSRLLKSGGLWRRIPPAAPTSSEMWSLGSRPRDPSLR